MYGPTLPGARVTLRAPRDDELPEMARRWTEVNETSAYVSDSDRRSSTAQHEAMLGRWRDADDRVVWALEVDGKLAGMASLRDIDRDNRLAVSGTHVYEDFRRRGVAREAVALRTAYAFRELDLHKLKSDTWVQNVAMVKILKEEGYREVGIDRAEELRDGTWHDIWLCELLREDWEKAAR